MATIERLVEIGLLVPISTDLGDRLPMRQLYGTLDFVAWLRDELPKLDEAYEGKANAPEQVGNLLDEYLAGDPMEYGTRFRTLNPTTAGVAELKTTDVRIFGWFYRKDRYIATFGHGATRTKDYNLYPGFRDETVRIRNGLDLDPPKFIEGTTASDLVSV